METHSRERVPRPTMFFVRDQPFEPRCELPRGLVPPVPVDPTGRRGPTRGQAAGPRWRRVGPNAYVPASANPGLPEQRALEAACHLPAGGAVTGWAGLRWAGGAYFDGVLRSRELAVPLALGHGNGRRTPSGVQLSYEPLTVEETVTWAGLTVTTPCRSLFYEMRRPGDWRDAVVAMDMAAAAELVSVRQMRGHLLRHTGWRRTEQVDRALGHASEHARSPAEVRLRLMWEVDAALPRPFVNREVFDLRGRLICIADLFDEEAGMVIEYDGAEHRKARRHSKDVAREERCRRVGLEYCKVTGPDMHRPAVVVERFHTTRARAKFSAASARGWTIDPPAGRTAPLSVDERIARRALAVRAMAERGVRMPPW